MGSWLSRKSRGMVEVLEQLSQEIHALEAAQRRHSRVERRVQSGFLFYGTVLFVIALAFGVAYFYSSPTALRGALAFLFVSLVPFLVYILYRCVHGVRSRHFERRTLRIRELTERKQEILEEVAEKETYKKAKEIIERFSTPSTRTDELTFSTDEPSTRDVNDERTVSQPRQLSLSKDVHKQSHLSKLEPSTAKQGSGPVHSAAARDERTNDNLRRRTIAIHGPGTSENVASDSLRADFSVTSVSRPSLRNTELSPMVPTSALASASVRGALDAARSIFIEARSVTQPLFSADRSLFERVTDLFLGDGPDSRYALICRYCYAHNGMALPNDFAHITFRCAYCSKLNPSQSTPRNTAVTEAPPFEPDLADVSRKSVGSIEPPQPDDVSLLPSATEDTDELLDGSEDDRIIESELQSAASN